MSRLPTASRKLRRGFRRRLLPGTHPEETLLATAICSRATAKARWAFLCCKASTCRSREGEFLSIVGQSGCGKSTLLHLLGTLDQPDAGEVHFDGHRIDNLPSASRDLLAQSAFGMIFQFYHLAA